MKEIERKKKYTSVSINEYYLLYRILDTYTYVGLLILYL
jgi:hypothetical protein